MKNLDFLPASFHRQRRRRHQRRRHTLYTVAVVLCLGSLHVVNTTRIRSAEAALQEFRQLDAGRESSRRQLVELRKRRDMLGQRMEIVNHLDDDAPINAIVAEITRHVDDNMALQSLSVELTTPVSEKGHSADPVFDHGRTRVVLRGVAAHDVQVGAFFGRLGQSPLFEKVELSFSRQTEKADRLMREFQLVFLVKRITLES